MQTIKAIIVYSPEALREQLDKVRGKITLRRRLLSPPASTGKRQFKSGWGPEPQGVPPEPARATPQQLFAGVGGD